MEGLVAIVLSGISAVAAVGAVTWAIYRDYGLKPRVKVTVMRGTLLTEITAAKPVLLIEGTNHGPQRCKIEMIEFRESSPKWNAPLRKLRGFLTHDYKSPHGGELPNSLNVGECVKLTFPWDNEAFAKYDWLDIGLRDSYGRYHRAPRRQLRAVQRAWREEFGTAE